ncbi:MAG TPA: bifunctional diguanylate cyclase/phosphodiesterase [Allosphingosinicella sp.]|nr:bifunctional diguanylate cyclase/phosphodiesterase [Allosphingosinicella sp.]
MLGTATSMREKSDIKLKLERISNFLMSLCAGVASFVFTLVAILMLSELNEQIVASATMGLFALLIVWVASEKPNSAHARAVAALIDRLLAVASGDLTSPAPASVRREMPALAAAVDNLFEQVRSNLDNVHIMALYDPVTALPNRVHFRREADRILEARKADEQLALLFIDLDGFKEVNDSLGHAHGDQVLAMVANRLRIVVKAETKAGSASHPLLARLAGDEFTLIFPNVTGVEEAERIAKRAVLALNEPFDLAGQSIDLGASIGIAACPAHGTDLTSLMKAADTAMYNAKASGRSRTSVYHAGMAAAVEQKAQTEKALREAFVRREFELAFQPQVCARTGAIVAGEALLRWNHRDGVRLPETFIGLAEESSLIVDIGGWVVDAAAESLRRWREAGMTQRLTFNVSPRQVERADFFRRLRAAMARTGSAPWLLELEFTETLAMKCGEGVIAELAILREQGVSIAIDDFGSGYSNLARMKDMPLDRVKLDRSLIAAVDTSDGARTIVSAVIHLIHGLGCEVVGEGVERKEQIDVLRAIGCDILQGFAFSEPLSEEEFVAWVRRNTPAERIPRIA